MEKQEVHWAHYPTVAAHPAAHAFVERLVLKEKRPKTVDAYARAIEDLLMYFAGTDPACVLEADEADLDGYIASLRRRSPKRRGRGGTVEDEIKVRHLTQCRLSDSTIAQRIIACRLFYEFLIRKRLRADPINPLAAEVMDVGESHQCVDQPGAGSTSPGSPRTNAGNTSWHMSLCTRMRGPKP